MRYPASCSWHHHSCDGSETCTEVAMDVTVRQILDSYKSNAPLAEAATITGPWYTDERIAELERQNVFGATWQMVARTAQLEKPGDFVTRKVGGEPIVVVRSADKSLRAFYNV